MAQVSITQAAKLVGKARSYLYTGYIKTGKLTVGTDDEGKKCIDTEELIRVFGRLKGQDVEDANNGSIEDRSEHRTKTSEDTFKVLLEEKERYIALLSNELEQSRQREQWLKEQWEAATKLLPGNSEKKGFWARLLGK